MRPLLAFLRPKAAWGAEAGKREAAPAAMPAGDSDLQCDRYSDEDGMVVQQYREIILSTAGKGRVPTVADLPCPVHRIHQALKRAANADAAPAHIRKIAKSALGSLVLFEGGSCSRSDTPQDPSSRR